MLKLTQISDGEATVVRDGVVIGTVERVRTPTRSLITTTRPDPGWPGCDIEHQLVTDVESWRAVWGSGNLARRGGFATRREAIAALDAAVAR